MTSFEPVVKRNPRLNADKRSLLILSTYTSFPGLPRPIAARSTILSGSGQLRA